MLLQWPGPVGLGPTNGVDEIQLLTGGGTISGGTFTITFGADTTDPIDWEATAAEVQAALELLPGIGGGAALP